MDTNNLYSQSTKGYKLLKVCKEMVTQCYTSQENPHLYGSLTYTENI